MTNAELIAAAKAELEGVTEGPWTPDGPPWNMIVWSGAENRVCFMAHSNGLHDHRDLMTANFIAAARSRGPQLIAALEAAEQEHTRLRYVLEGVRAAIDTGRNEPLLIWRDQINIVLGD